MESKKKLLFLVGGVVVVVFLAVFSAKWFSQKDLAGKTNKVPASLNEEEKGVTQDKVAEETKETPADPEEVTVSAMQGVVVAVSKESITIKDEEEKESVHNLVQEKLGVFKKSVGEITIINVEDIKAGDKVKLEARQSDGLVNSIMVE